VLYIIITVLLLSCLRQKDNEINETIVEEFVKDDSREINQDFVDLQEYNPIQKDNALEHPLSVFTIVDKSPFKYSQNHGNTDYIDFHDIAYGNGRFVAVGDSWTGSYVHGYIAYSDDGLTWNLVDTFFRNGFSAVAYGNERFVAVAVNNKAFYSSDGIEWNAAEDNPFGSLREIVYGNDLFMAIYHSGIAYSYDGEVWDNIEDIFDETETTCLFYGNNRFYAGSYGKLAYSYEGKTWNIVENDAFGSLPIRSFAYGDNRLLVFSYQSDLSSEYYGEDDEYGVNIAYSDDGEKWHSTDLKYYFSEWSWIRNITYNIGYFIAVGGEKNELRVACSRDGVSWVNVDDGHYPYRANFYTRYNASAYGGGNHVIAGTEGTIRVSQWPIYNEQK
jgi:hypothetical protein